MSAEAGEVRQCRIEQQLGRRRSCPGAKCAYWREGDRPEADGCVFERVDFAGRDELAQWLHDLRERLDRDR